MKRSAKDYIFVGIQILLFGVYLFEFHTLEFEIPNFALTVSGVIAVLGGLIIVISILQLNKSLSPFPSPKSDSELIQTGLYKFIRHPIYTGILCLTFGYGCYKTSGYKVLISITLLVLFYFKSLYEEKGLLAKFPKYRAYMEKTGRFLPKF